MRHELMQQALDQITDETRSKIKEYVNMKLTWFHPTTYKSFEIWGNDYFRIFSKYETYVMYFTLGEVETTSSNENFDKLVELANVLFESNLVKPRN